MNRLRDDASDLRTNAEQAVGVALAAALQFGGVGFDPDTGGIQHPVHGAGEPAGKHVTPGGRVASSTGRMRQYKQRILQPYLSRSGLGIGGLEPELPPAPL